mgnify:FL=1
MEMSIGQSSSTEVSPEWELPTPPTDLPFDDGVPLESPRHRIAMNVLIRSVQCALHERSDFFAGGNMFVYYSRNQAMNRDFRGPDFFVTLDVDGDREQTSCMNPAPWRLETAAIQTKCDFTH